MALDRPPYPETIDPVRRRLLGSHYTPRPLAAHLAQAALAPLLPAPGRRLGRGAVEEALGLRVLDPAAGDGAFLVEAARCMARRLSRASGLQEAGLRAEVARRCLAGIDIDPVAAALARLRVKRFCGAAPPIVAGDALSDAPVEGPQRFSLPAVAGSFDAILGNPPWGGWNRGLDAASKGDYRSRFRLARGMLDPAMLFLERCIDWLRPGGRLGLVLPDYFLTKNYPDARAHVLAHLRLEELARWGMAFPGVNLGACSLVGTRMACGKRSAAPARRPAPVRCLPRGPGGPVVFTRVAAFRREPGHVFNLELDEGGRRLLARLMRQGTPLGRLVEAHEGIHSGNARSRLFVRPGAGPSSGEPARALRPMVLGRSELRPFVLRPKGWRVLYDPGALRRSQGEYANLGRLSWYRAPKLLVRRTGDRIVAAVDRKGVMASNNLFVARVRPGARVTPELLAGWLNAPLATWCFRAMVPRAGSLFAELKLRHLGRLPVPPFGPGAAVRRKAARLAALSRRLEDASMEDGAPARKAVMDQVDAIVSDLAGLSAADRERIHCAPGDRAMVRPL